MRSRPLLGALVALLPALSLAEVSAPATPPGLALSEWLDAFNSGERARLGSFIETQAPWLNLDESMRWRSDTGGYDLLEIYASDQTNVFFRVKARTDGTEEAGRVTVSEANPMTISALGTWRIPPGATFEPVTLDEAARARVVKFAADALDSSYVDPKMGKKMSATLSNRQARGDYSGTRFGDDFASRLTNELQQVSHDGHVEVRFSYFVRPAESPALQSAAEALRLAAINCGFEKAEHLRPNIGYLKFNMFADPQFCAATAGAAMTFLADSDALIIDLRDNHGGHAGMTEYIASYLFDERTHLGDIYSRRDDTARQTWTLPSVPGKRFVGKPVYVLVSKRTFSAAEYISNVLKNLKRATLIGETTGGGAHTGETQRIDNHFSVRVPTGRPITKTDWEGKGVEPDVKVAADQALDVALKIAVEQISKNRSGAAPGR